MRQKLLLLAAVFFGVLAFVLTFQQINLERQKILGATTEVALLMVTTDMAVGDVIQKENLRPVKQRRFRSQLVNLKEVTVRSVADVIGRKVQFPVSRGSFLTWNDLQEASRRRTGMSSNIEPGFRAISVSVDSTSSVTGLIQPYDHIDIVGTFRFPEMKGDQAFDTVTMTILQNVVVLACGTDMGQGATGKKGRGYSTLTLSLTPKEVEMIIFASQKGRLHMSLRNYEETKVETDVQSVNFNYLEKNVRKYTVEREKKFRSGKN